MISTLDGNTSFDQYSVGIKDFNGLAGTWKDAEDGELAMNTIATGSVDSIIRHTISIDPKASFELYYYILAARDLKSLLETSKEITVENLERMLKRTENFGNYGCQNFRLTLTIH